MNKCKTLSLKYKINARAKVIARAISMQKFLSKIVNALKIKEKRAKTAPKVEQKRVFWVFSTEYLFKNAKNKAFMHFFLHNCLILVRSTGIEPAWSYPQDP